MQGVTYDRDQIERTNHARSPTRRQNSSQYGDWRGGSNRAASVFQPAKRRARRRSTHPAFGIWAKRSDITDTALFAAQLRQRVEMRADERKIGKSNSRQILPLEKLAC